MGISPTVGDKLIFFIYCPDINKVVSCSNIRSADPIRGTIINKIIDNENLTSDIKSDLSIPKISDSGEISRQTLRKLKRLRQQDLGESLKKNTGEHLLNKNVEIIKKRRLNRLKGEKR